MDIFYKTAAAVLLVLVGFTAGWLSAASQSAGTTATPAVSGKWELKLGMDGALMYLFNPATGEVYKARFASKQGFEHVPVQDPASDPH